MEEISTWVPGVRLAKRMAALQLIVKLQAMGENVMQYKRIGTKLFI